MNADLDHREMLGHAAEIVAAFVSSNTVSADDLPKIISNIFTSLVAAGAPASEPSPAPTPAVPVKKSVFPDHLVCLEDGRKLKTLKRHLARSFNMTPAQYRQKCNLSPDYPMVAPNYSAQRSGLAKQLGLGRKPKAAAETPPAPARRSAGRRRAG